MNVIAYSIKYKTIYTENRVINTYGKKIKYKRVQFLLNERHNRLVVVAARFSVKKTLKLNSPVINFDIILYYEHRQQRPCLPSPTSRLRQRLQ